MVNWGAITRRELRSTTLYAFIVLSIFLMQDEVLHFVREHVGVNPFWVGVASFLLVLYLFEVRI